MNDYKMKRFHSRRIIIYSNVSFEEVKMPVVPNIVKRKENIRNENEIASTDILKEANYYCRATKLLEKSRREDELFSPVLTNATFSCELYSKAILFNSNKYLPKKHNLEQLYKSFPENVKKKLNDGCDKERFEEFIHEIGELFEFWRYNYEKSKAT